MNHYPDGVKARFNFPTKLENKIIGTVLAIINLSRINSGQTLLRA